MSKIRVLLLKIAVFFLPVNCCFASTIYVNINNATPGAGASWATAYTDLNAALSAASSGDHIWVAQGTYLPTQTTDRSISFMMKNNVTVLGGFTGVETVESSRNYKTNITILSGDIGGVGNPTDNSYDVVTFYNTTVNTSNATLDGFTIENGNSNKNPFSTAPQMYNGGGALLAANDAGTLTYAIVANCTIINNNGVWGAGCYSFATGSGSGVSLTLSYCFFQSNSGGLGCGVSSVALAGAGASGETVVANSIFFEDYGSPKGQGSVLGAYADGAGSTLKSSVYFCSLYTNPPPITYNQQQNGGASTIDYHYSIIWRLGGIGTYALSDYTLGSNVSYDNCDLAVTDPPAGCINSDPQFVDPFGTKDFHVQPCSPVVDAVGIPSTQWPNDYDGVARPVGPADDMGVYETTKGLVTAPTASSPTYCQNATASALTATGTNLLWYTVATGGTGTSFAPTPSTTATGSVTYYVTQTLAGGCESSRTPVTVTVSSPPAAPATTPQSYCQNATAAALTASGTNLLWYTAATGGTGSSTAPTPSTTATGSTTYYVSQTSGCESPRASITVTINSSPAAPATTPQSYCQNATAAALTATGTNLLWYTAATGGPGSSTAPTPLTTATGSTTYYVSQTSGCESPRASITVTVNSQPAAPATTPQSYCQNATAAALTATGTNLLWYTAATGGTGSSTAPTPSTTAIGSTTYYVSQTSGCESPRASITVTINSQPAAPATTPQSYCQNATAAALTATGTSLLWYTAATGGTGSSTAPTPSTVATGSTTYYVSQTSGCESPRTAIVVTINPNPTADFTWKDVCAGTASSINAVAGTSTPDNYIWNFGSPDAVTGSGAGPYGVAWNSGGNYAVTLTFVTGVCQNQAQHNVTVYTLPNVAISPVTTTLCAGHSVTLEASGAASYAWSPATNLSDPSIYDPAALMQGDILYTVTGTDANGCTDTAQIALQVSANCLGYYIPTAFSPNGDGKNDLFHVKTSDVPKSFSMLIFNRFGGKIFESTNVGTGWNGVIGGHLAEPGAYVYLIVITTSAGNTVKYKGTVMLVP